MLNPLGVASLDLEVFLREVYLHVLRSCTRPLQYGGYISILQLPLNICLQSVVIHDAPKHHYVISYSALTIDYTPWFIYYRVIKAPDHL
jgi:hypothetical protein